MKKPHEQLRYIEVKKSTDDPIYILGLVIKNTFLKFYISTKMTFDEYMPLIPKEFIGISETEFKINRKRYPKANARALLKKYGYIIYKE